MKVVYSVASIIGVIGLGLLSYKLGAYGPAVLCIVCGTLSSIFGLMACGLEEKNNDW